MNNSKLGDVGTRHELVYTAGASPIGDLDPAEAIFAPVLTPTILDQPVIIGARRIIPVYYDGVVDHLAALHGGNNTRLVTLKQFCVAFDSCCLGLFGHRMFYLSY